MTEKNLLLGFPCCSAIYFGFIFVAFSGWCVSLFLWKRQYLITCSILLQQNYFTASWLGLLMFSLIFLVISAIYPMSFVFGCALSALLFSTRFTLSMNNENTYPHVWLSFFFTRTEVKKSSNSPWSFKVEILMANLGQSSTYVSIEGNRANCNSNTATWSTMSSYDVTSCWLFCWSKTAFYDCPIFVSVSQSILHVLGHLTVLNC